MRYLIISMQTINPHGMMYNKFLAPQIFPFINNHTNNKRDKKWFVQRLRGNQFL